MDASSIIRINADRIRQAVSVYSKVEQVCIVGVCKTRNVPDIEMLLSAGINDIGENRVAEAVKKHEVLGDAPVWHMIGRLQQNKVRKTAGIFDVIHSVASEKLALSLEKALEEKGRTMTGFIQVNLSKEESKQGVDPEDAARIAELPLSRLKLVGLMTMAPLSENPETARNVFAKCRELRDEMMKTWPHIRRLSMGMSMDYTIALDEGADTVRIGTAFFKGV